MDQVVDAKEREKQIDENIQRLLNEKKELRKTTREDALKSVRSFCRQFGFTYPMLKEHLKISPKVMIETREYKQGEYERLVEKVKAEKRERNRKYKQKKKSADQSDNSKKKSLIGANSQAKKENENEQIKIENVITATGNTSSKKTKRRKSKMTEASDNFAKIDSFL